MPSGYSNRNRVGRNAYFSCWNCNESGHAWRNCRRKIVCQKCSSAGHISRFCRTGDAVRYFEVEEPDDIACLEEEEKLSMISEETAPTNDCLTIAEIKKSKQPAAVNNPKFIKRQKMKSQNEKSRQQEDYIGDWLDYVNGKTNVSPSHSYNPTLISDTRTEIAANKPL